MIRGISPALRDDLLAYLLCTSPDRARLIAELTARNPGIAVYSWTWKQTTICGPNWRWHCSVKSGVPKRLDPIPTQPVRLAP